MSKVVNVFVVSPDTHSERRVDPHITVEQFKVRPYETILFEGTKIFVGETGADYRDTRTQPVNLYIGF